MNEAYGPTGNVGYRLNAVRALNQVRNRVGVEMPAVPTAISKEELREKIRNERRVELAFEDHRFWGCALVGWSAPETLGTPLRGVEITKISDEEFEIKPIEVEKEHSSRKCIYIRFLRPILIRPVGYRIHFGKEIITNKHEIR